MSKQDYESNQIFSANFWKLSLYQKRLKVQYQALVSSGALRISHKTHNQMHNPFRLQIIPPLCFTHTSCNDLTVANIPHVQYLKPKVLYYIGRPVSRSVSHDTLIPWYPCPACDIVLERPVCCRGSGAPDIPRVIVVFHLQQEKDLFSSQTLFPCKHLTGMCVCVCVWVFYLCVSKQI